MNRRVLIVEPDASTRRMIERVLSSSAFAPISVATIEESHTLIDGAKVEAALVELRATNAAGVEGVRSLRADHPGLPIIVTGTFLTPRVMQELIRLGVADVLPKPFTPRDLLEALERVLRNAHASQEGALEYAAAMAAARRALVDGRPRDAEVPLARARATSPLDAESMALLALARELEGEDQDADRACRAAMALMDEVPGDAAPLEGLARLAAYRGARVVPMLDRARIRTLWLVRDARSELLLGPPLGAAPDAIVFALALAAGDAAAMYAREGGAATSFLIAVGSMNGRLAQRLARSFDGATIVAHPATVAALDLPRPEPREGEERVESASVSRMREATRA